MRASWKQLFSVLVTVESVWVALARSYGQTDSIVSQGFLDAFGYETIQDPTNGRVNYVDGATAAQDNLTYASNGHFILRADATKYLEPNGPGRDSIRLKSYKQYTNSAMIFNIRHMPTGCGTWPAVWTVGADWPNQGEIDILEGINNVGPNQVTLHTSAGCTMPAFRAEKGEPISNNCDAGASNNEGCGVKLSDPRSFGPNFNDNGGGWYAMERTSDFIKVWFWPRSGAPPDVQNGDNTVNTDSWGVPDAYFSSNWCSISKKFGPQNIIIDLTFCGDWAGNDYGLSGCPSTCVDYVNNNPSAFRDAYFDFEWLKIYA
ncbi:laminarinase [Amanita rubescens]|nr:laminarinase [Amanita rubescens]